MEFIFTLTYVKNILDITKYQATLAYVLGE